LVGQLPGRDSDLADGHAVDVVGDGLFCDGLFGAGLLGACFVISEFCQPLAHFKGDSGNQLGKQLDGI
jgi:hypothetical protein